MYQPSKHYSQGRTRVRIDPIPDASYAFRAYEDAVDSECPISDVDAAYVVSGVVTITGDVAVVTLTQGRVPMMAWADFDRELRALGARFCVWVRHRVDGSRKPVVRDLTST